MVFTGLSLFLLDLIHRPRIRKFLEELFPEYRRDAFVSCMPQAQREALLFKGAPFFVRKEFLGHALVEITRHQLPFLLVERRLVGSDSFFRVVPVPDVRVHLADPPDPCPPEVRALRVFPKQSVGLSSAGQDFRILCDTLKDCQVVARGLDDRESNRVGLRKRAVAVVDEVLYLDRVLPWSRKDKTL